jgi:kynurenine formamidase
MKKWVTIFACATLFLFLIGSLAWAGNWVTKSYGKTPAPKMTPYLKSLIKTGNVYDIGVVRSIDMPLWPGHPKLMVLNYKYHGETKDLEPATYENDLVICCNHSGCHMDALCHIGERQADGSIKIYGGKTAAQIKEWWGLNWMDGSQMVPVVLRGVVLDFCKYFNEDLVMREITAADVKGCMAAQGIKVMPDVPTAFLMRTGWIVPWLKGPAEIAKVNGEGGPNVEAEKYLESIGAVVTGADNVSYEYMPNITHPVHRYMLTYQGIGMVELCNLEGPCADGFTEGVYIALPTKFRGTSGSNIDPILIN